MSAFGNYYKDDLVDSIKNLIENKKDNNPDIQFNELIKEVMEVVSYGIEKGFWEIENL